MARVRITSPRALDKLEQRVAAMRQIDPALDLGNGLTVAAAEELSSSLRNMVLQYNSLISELDAKANDIQTTTSEVSDFSVRILQAVAVKYGRDSNQYEMAGGKRLSEKKHPSRKQQA